MFASLFAYQILGALVGGVWAFLLCALGRRLRGRRIGFDWADLLLAAVLQVPAGLAVVVLAHELFRRGVLGSQPFFLVIDLVFWAAFLWLPLGGLRFALSRRSLPGSSMLPPVPLLARLLLGLFSLVAPSLGFYAWFVEPSTVVVSRHDLEVPGLAPVTRERPLRILHLSDLQTSYLGSRELKVNELGQELEPDLILFSGDLTTRTLWGDAPERSADAVLSRLSAPFGFFGIAGDSETPEKAKEILERNEHVLLRNERRTLNIRGQTVVIIGLDRASPDFSLLDEKVPEGALSILLAHSPDVVLDLGWDPETSTLRRPATAPPLPHLILTGHTHGGQIVLPFVGAPVTLTRLGRRYASGLFDLKGPLLHVSRGLGMEGHFAPRIRFLCPPEVTLFTVRAAAGKSVAEEETVFTRPGG